MKNKIVTQISFLFLLIITGFFILGFTPIKKDSDKNLVKTSTWFIAGPATESQETINRIRQEKGIVKVTAKDNPAGEIELNVLITNSDSNDGAPTNLSDNSKFV